MKFEKNWKYIERPNMKSKEFASIPRMEEFFRSEHSRPKRSL